MFNDERLSELYFRYKARNWPESLTPDENSLWQKHKEMRLSPEHITEYIAKCDLLLTENPEQSAVLQDLKNWISCILIE